MISQYRQDEYVLSHHGHKSHGFFVDIGAHDGVEFSNTFRLVRDYQWTGILAECNPRTVETLKQNRNEPIEELAIWSESGKTVEFTMVEREMLSGVTETLHYEKAKNLACNIIKIGTISLSDFLDKYNCPEHIDYMSMDIEGSEYNVLSTYDFSRTFGILSIEHRNDKYLIYDIMRRNGYVPRLDYWCTELETIFTREN
jgi:FkbM family methyltransferase